MKVFTFRTHATLYALAHFMGGFVSVGGLCFEKRVPTSCHTARFCFIVWTRVNARMCDLTPSRRHFWICIVASECRNRNSSSPFRRAAKMRALSMRRARAGFEMKRLCHSATEEEGFVFFCSMFGRIIITRARVYKNKCMRTWCTRPFITYLYFACMHISNPPW